uniref:CRISPR system precrRNA processing endoribonuclease RAMP protein Cas6 n=1 Tax=Frankia sp. Cas3 TaxID=3073926 RepID=UPI002AD456D0
DMRLATAEYVVKIGAPKRRGCVGFVSYTLAEPAGVPAGTRSAIESLARFACYAGIGDRTASGMGYTVIDPDGHHTRDRPRRRPGPAASTGTAR